MDAVFGGGGGQLECPHVTLATDRGPWMGTWRPWTGRAPTPPPFVPCCCCAAELRDTAGGDFVRGQFHEEILGFHFGAGISPQNFAIHCTSCSLAAVARDCCAVVGGVRSSRPLGSAKWAVVENVLELCSRATQAAFFDSWGALKFPACDGPAPQIGGVPKISPPRNCPQMSPLCDIPSG